MHEIERWPAQPTYDLLSSFLLWPIIHFRGHGQSFTDSMYTINKLPSLAFYSLHLN